MFQVHDYVVLGATGVCQIVDISREAFGDDEAREYYVLNPLGGNGLTINIPTDNQTVPLRAAMTRQEVIDLVATMSEGREEWVEDDNTRRAIYNDALHDGDQRLLLQTVRSVAKQKTQLEQEGKKLPSADLEALKAAEKMLTQEICLVLDLDPDDVIPFIMRETNL